MEEFEDIKSGYRLVDQSENCKILTGLVVNNCLVVLGSSSTSRKILTLKIQF